MAKGKTKQARDPEEITAAGQAPEPPKTLQVTAPPGGFRRGGRRWTGVCEIVSGELSKEQIAAIRNEPRLCLEEI